MQGSIKIAVGVRIRKIRASWWIDIHQDRERIRHNLRVLTREDAERKARLLVASLESGELTPASFQLTLDKAVIEYLKSKSEIEQRTRENLEVILGRFQDFIEGQNLKLLTQVKAVQIEAFRDWAKCQKTPRTDKPLSPVTVNNQLEKVSSFFKWAVDRCYVRRNPARGVRVKVPAARPKPVLTPAEIKRLLRACPPALRDLAVVLVNTGLRIGEALSLKARDLNSTRGTLLIWNSKMNRYDEVQLNAVALRVLRAKKLAANGGALFKSTAGADLDRRNIRRDLMAAGRRARLKVTGAHMLKRSFCSALAPKVSAAVLKEIARHKDLRTTMSYYVSLPSTAPPIVAS